jgi:hypothetical protein
MWRRDNDFNYSFSTQEESLNSNEDFLSSENGLKEDFKDSTLTQHHEVVKVLKKCFDFFQHKKDLF